MSDIRGKGEPVERSTENAEDKEPREEVKTGKRPNSSDENVANKIQHLEPILSIKLPDVMHSSRPPAVSASDTTDTGKQKDSNKSRDDSKDSDQNDTKDEDDEDDDGSSIDDDHDELMKSIVSDHLEDESIDDDGKLLDKDNLEFKTELCLLQTEPCLIDSKLLTKAEQEQLKQQLQERERERMQ